MDALFIGPSPPSLGLVLEADLTEGVKVMESCQSGEGCASAGRKRARPSLRFLPLVALTLCGGLAAQDPSVILITVDTLRADRVEPYGYESAETPTMLRLARDGVTFENAICQIPITLPSHASLLTGTYPMFHGLQDVVGRLRDDVPIITEWFKQREYATGAFVGASVLSKDWGLQRGFDHYDDDFAQKSGSGQVDFDRAERSAEEVIDRALDWVGERGRKPFFLWVHVYDPHDPYTPPASFAERFKDRPYDGEIAYVDQQIGRLVERLDDLGIYDSSLIVFTADHGESLGEHDETYHGFFIYEASLRVPLIVKPSGGNISSRSVKGRRVSNQVRSVDVAPTIVQLLGERAPEWMQGEALTAFMLGRRQGVDLPAYGETHYPRVHFAWSPLFSLSNSRHKYIEAPRPELYDLQADPGETTNVIEGNRALSNRLKEELESLRTRYGSERSHRPAEEVDPEAMARLGSLGYISFSAGSTNNQDWAKLPDPKDKIGVYNKLNDAISLSRKGRTKEAMREFQAVAAQEPGMPLVHFLLAAEASKAGLHLQAIQEYRKTLEYNPDSDVARFNLVRSYVEAGLVDKAIAVARELIQRQPDHYAVREILARTLMRTGDIEGAIEQERMALQSRPDLAEGYNTLGSYLFFGGRYAEAIESYRKVLEFEPGHPRAHVNLALTYLKLNDFDNAVVEARRAIQATPGAALAHLYLGQAYLGKGMTEEARKEFQRAKQLDPNLQVPSS